MSLTTTRTATRKRTPAFDAIGVLDLLVYIVLGIVGAPREPLTELTDVTPLDDVTYRNARRLVCHFEGRNIQAIKALRDASGFRLVDAKDAWEQIIDTYGLERENYRGAILRALDNNDDQSLEYYARKMRETRGQ